MVNGISLIFQEAEEKDTSVSEKFDLVMQTARKVQNFLGNVDDSLEKVKR